MLTTLKNGRTILAQKRLESGLYVVLAETWTPTPQPQLACYMASPDGLCFSGQYGYEALDSFRQRTGGGTVFGVCHPADPRLNGEFEYC